MTTPAAAQAVPPTPAEAESAAAVTRAKQASLVSAVNTAKAAHSKASLAWATDARGRLDSLTPVESDLLVAADQLEAATVALARK